jgi:hypothetical protein
MIVMKKDILKSPPFLIALFLLLLNDFVLKAVFHNWLTGKLSDFAGLFVFVLFWSALFPRYKKQIFFATALSFVIWKSPLSMPFIEFWSNNFYKIDRVVDYSDLIALIILPLAYYYSENRRVRIRKDFQTAVICLISLFAFCATSKTYSVIYNDKYYFTAPPEQVENFLRSCGNISWKRNNTDYTELILTYSSSAQFAHEDSNGIEMKISREGDRTLLVLVRVLERHRMANTTHLGLEADHDSFDDLLIHAKTIGFIEKNERFGLIRILERMDSLNVFLDTILALSISLLILLAGAIFNFKKKPFFKLVATKIALVISISFILLYCAKQLVDR